MGPCRCVRCFHEAMDGLDEDPEDGVEFLALVRRVSTAYLPVLPYRISRLNL